MKKYSEEHKHIWKQNPNKLFAHHVYCFLCGWSVPKRLVLKQGNALDISKQDPRSITW